MNKRLTAAVLLLLLAAAAWAQDFGIGPLVSVEMTKETNGSDYASTTDTTIGAIVPLYLEKGFELCPEMSLTLHSEKNTSVILFGGGIVDGRTRTDFSFGAGAYWTMGGSGAFGFKSGVHGLFTLIGEESTAGNDSYSHPRVAITMPLIIDMALGKTLIVRVDQPVARLVWDTEYITNGGTDTTDTSLLLESFYDGLAPRFSFIVKL